jgi:hypothetical protein
VTEQSRPSTWSLRREDAAAVDAIFENGLAPGSIPSHEREVRLVQLLSTLDQGIGSAGAPDAGDREALIDVTLARLEREAARVLPREAALTPMDEEAVEAWMLAEQDGTRVPASLRARAAKVQALGGLVRDMPHPSGRDLLVERTMRRLSTASREPETTHAIASGGSGGLRWANLVSAAAVLCIATAVIWPVLAGVRGTTGRLACRGNMMDAGTGLARYASDHEDAIPARASFDGGGVWWDVGVPGRSNSQNLFSLVREGYSEIGRLACGGNKHAAYERAQTTGEDWKGLNQVSYSYRVASRPTLVSMRSASGSVLLADRSPVVLRAVRGEWIYPLENSPNHGGEGQNVLRGDGSSAWIGRPVVSRPGAPDDNIWLPESIEQAIRQARAAMSGRASPIKGSELPASREDNLLGP